MQTISFIIVNFNNAGLTIDCVNSIKQHLTGKYNLQIIVIDNGSTKTDRDLLKSLDSSHSINLIFSEKNLGFGAGNNLANKIVTGDFVVYLNNDTSLIDDSIKHSVELLSNNEKIGLVGAQLLTDELTANISFGYFPSIKTLLSELFNTKLLRISKRGLGIVPRNDDNRPKEVEYIVGACMILRQRDFIAMNGFDEAFFMYFEDTDYSHRIKYRQNKRVIYNPRTRIIHKTSSTANKYLIFSRRNFYRSMRLFLHKHYSDLHAHIVNILCLLLILRRLLRKLLFPNSIDKVSHIFLDLRCLLTVGLKNEKNR